MDVLGKPASVMVCAYEVNPRVTLTPHLDSVYRLPVQSPSATAKEIKSRALDLQPVLEQVQVKHPLVSNSALSTMGWRSLTYCVVGYTGALLDVCLEYV